MLAFVTNRSFVESRTFDGFRKMVAQEFAELYVVDLGGDVRANPKLSGTKHNVFGIQTGVAISFLVKRKGSKAGRVFYARRPEMETAEEKLAFLGSTALSRLAMDELRPDVKQNWLNLTSNDFDELMPIASKDAKGSKKASEARAIFKLFSLGVVTARDEWVYDSVEESLAVKVRYLIQAYNDDVARLYAAKRDATLSDKLDYSIKWTRAVKNDLRNRVAYAFVRDLVRRSIYRPFVARVMYFSKQLNEMQYLQREVFAHNEVNIAIAISGCPASKPFQCCAIDCVPSYDFLEKTQTLPLYRYELGQRIDNITDWSLAEFKKHYQPGRGKKPQPITKEAIFHYVYAVLHDPLYRETYAQNLKREFPRIPLYGDSETTFWQWAAWGKALMALHIGYEQVAPFALLRNDTPDEKVRASGQSPKVILKADKATGRIAIDSETALAGVPPEAWAYTLGNRCAIDWVLDQYKEKKPKDPAIREKFDTYRFKDHKEKLIDLLARVTTVSVETVRIVAAMKAGPR